MADKKIITKPKKIVMPSKAALQKIVNAMSQDDGSKVTNGLEAAIFKGQNPFGTEPLSRTDTIERNLRYYMVTNQRQTISWAYTEIGLFQTICTIPIEDALRGGLEIKTKQADPAEIEQVEADMEEHDDLGVLGQTAIWNRAYGGAGLLIVTGADPTTEFNPNEVKEGGPLGFRDADLWELFWSQQSSDISQDLMNVNRFNNEETFNFYGQQIHKSRVMTMKGIAPPSFLRPTLRGWGLSVLETLVRSINQFLKTNDLIFECIDEFKVDYYKIKNLANTLLQVDGESKIHKRIQLANAQKNFQNAVVMDAEDDHDAKELNFAGISDTMTGIRIHVAADMRMPLTKLFGISAAGFSSGEDDIENYNAMIESSIRKPLKPKALKMVQLRFKQRFGYVPDDLRVGFKPLRILSAEQEENVKTYKHARLLATQTAGLCTAKEFKEGCNKDDLLPITLDTSIDKIEPEGDKEAEPGAPKAPKSTTQAKEAKT